MAADNPPARHRPELQGRGGEGREAGRNKKKRGVSPEEPEESLTPSPCARQGRMGAGRNPRPKPSPSVGRAV